VHLLDTDTLTHLHAGNPGVVHNLDRLADPDVATTIITKAELLRGRIDFLLKAGTGSDLLRAQQFLARTEELPAQIPVVPFDEAAAAQFERLCATRALRKLGRADILVASIVLSRRAVLATRNIRHFSKIAGLKAINWVD